MMYRHTLDRVYNRPQLILPEKLEAIRQVVTQRALGTHVDAAVIEAAKAQAELRKPAVTRSVAVLPILGTLAKRMDLFDDFSGGASTDRIGRDFDQLMADEAVGAIVLDVDSPGGETFGTMELADKIFAARGQKPIVAVANPTAASAAYWIASAADELVVTPSGWVGSIGVVACHYDFSAWNEQIGVKPTYIYSGQHKVEFNQDQPLSAESVAYYQAEVDKVYQQFLKAVARNRETTAADVRAHYGQGRMLQAADAKAAGMVDRIETLEETIARLAGNRPAKGRGARAEIERRRLGLAEIE